MYFAFQMILDGKISLVVPISSAICGAKINRSGSLGTLYAVLHLSATSSQIRLPIISAIPTQGWTHANSIHTDPEVVYEVVPLNPPIPGIVEIVTHMLTQSRLILINRLSLQFDSIATS